ncbi:MAG: Trm112 family protein [Pseudomonadota bacterium]
MDSKLLEVLVCPVSKAPLLHKRQDDGSPDLEELWCVASRLAYPIKDGIPVLLESEARTLSEEEIASQKS